MSSSKVCHSESSPYYDRLKNFTSYQSMEKCLASGGRPAKSSGSGKSEKRPSSYKRSDFGRGWADFDKDCQNTRHEILAEKSTTKPRWDARGCSVIAGQWISSFQVNASMTQRHSTLTISFHSSGLGIMGLPHGMTENESSLRTTQET